MHTRLLIRRENFTSTLDCLNVISDKMTSQPDKLTSQPDKI